MEPKIYILLPVHNRVQITERFIDCLIKQTYSNYHLILIDDGSTDNTDQMVKSKVSNLSIIKGDGTWWWAGSLQKGIEYLESDNAKDDDIVMFANDDILFNADLLQAAVEKLAPNMLLLPQLLNEDTGQVEESGVNANFKGFSFKTAQSSTSINCLPTRGIFTHISTIRTIGSFRPKILPHYWSDYEYTIRAGKKGVRLKTARELVIIADKDQTGLHDVRGMDFLSFLSQYFSKRSVPNPVYASVFILLASPILYIPINISKVWGKALIVIIKQLLRSLRKSYRDLYASVKIRLQQSNYKIIIGSASTKQTGWVSTNYPMLDLTDKKTFLALFEPNSVKNFLAEHVWEHLTLEQSAIACSNCFLFLKKGGVLRIAVPDGYHSDPDYIKEVMPGGHGSGADDHKVLYNYKSLSEVLESAGFSVKLLEWFDEGKQFNQRPLGNENGYIMRSSLNDQRNKSNPTQYTSLIVDAIKL